MNGINWLTDCPDKKTLKNVIYIIYFTYQLVNNIDHAYGHLLKA